MSEKSEDELFEFMPLVVVNLILRVLVGVLDGLANFDGGHELAVILPAPERERNANFRLPERVLGSYVLIALLEELDTSSSSLRSSAANAIEDIKLPPWMSYLNFV